VAVTQRESLTSRMTSQEEREVLRDFSPDDICPGYQFIGELLVTPGIDFGGEVREGSREEEVENKADDRTEDRTALIGVLICVVHREVVILYTLNIIMNVSIIL